MATQNDIHRPRMGGAKRVAAENGFAYRTFLDLIHRGEIPHVRVGKAIYVERADVNRWIETRKETSAA